MKKGMFFTLDAIFALAITFIFLGFVFFSTSPALFAEQRITTTGQDLLEVIHIQNITTDAPGIEEYLEKSLPTNLCGKLISYDTDIEEIFTVTTCNDERIQRTIIRRSHEEGIIELILWQK